MKKVFGVLGLLLIAGCGDKDESPIKAVEQRVDEPGLMHTWEGPCKLKILDKSARQFVRFSGADLKEGYVLYEDEDCKTGSVQLVYDGSFTIPKEPSKGQRYLDNVVKTGSLKALTPAGAELLDDLDVCGVETWAVGQSVDITAAERGVKCPFRALPANEFNTFVLEKAPDGTDLLFLGAAGLFEKGGPNDPANRPKEVDRSQDFRHSEWKP